MKYDGFRHDLEFGDEKIKFDARPPAEVLSALKANGFRWNPTQKTWWRRQVGEYADLLGWIDRKVNPNRPDGACWDCKDPNGFFRSYGAATPVLCDSCHVNHEASR